MGIHWNKILEQINAWGTSKYTLKFLPTIPFDFDKCYMFCRSKRRRAAPTGENLETAASGMLYSHLYQLTCQANHRFFFLPSVRRYIYLLRFLLCSYKLSITSITGPWAIIQEMTFPSSRWTHSANCGSPVGFMWIYANQMGMGHGTFLGLLRVGQISAWWKNSHRGIKGFKVQWFCTI